MRSFRNTRQIAGVHCKSSAVYPNMLIVEKEYFRMVPTNLNKGSSLTEADISNPGVAVSIAEYANSAHLCLLTIKMLCGFGIIGF